MRPRVIPVLLLCDRQLYKTVRFKNPKYIGDPRVAVKIFNDRGCDELVLLDISATPQRREPDYELIEEIVTESFMPVAYGGGINSPEQAMRIFKQGVEKIVLNTHAIGRPKLIREIADLAGSSSTVVAIDVGSDWRKRRRVFSGCGRLATALKPVEWAKQAVDLGAGEIIVNSIDRDGTMTGYELPLISEIAAEVEVPVIALGGARSAADFRKAVESGAAAAAAGSCFVFQGPHRAVLINYPDDAALNAVFA